MRPLFFLMVQLLAISAFAFDHTHSLWSQTLTRHVVVQYNSALFKYSELRKDRADFDAYLMAIQSVKKSEYQNWSQPQQLAFLFNSYNALTVEIVLQNSTSRKPLKSIRDIGNILKNTWKIKFFDFLGQKSHLDHIEHELTRPNFDEPRLHFAFNCASIGCPNLLKEAFTAEKLENQLETAARGFLADPSRNRVSKDGKSLELSQIFNWYKDDFEKSSRFKSLREFLVAHMKLSEPQVLKLRSGEMQIQFLDYDWNLNASP